MYSLSYLRFHFHTIVEVTEVKYMVELMHEIKLVKMAMLQCTHSLQYIVIVLIAPTSVSSLMKTIICQKLN